MQQAKSDEFVEPVIIGKPARIEDGDQIICYKLSRRFATPKC